MFINLSHQLNNTTPTFPGDPKCKIIQNTYYKEAGYTHFQINCGTHAGTHIDGLSHMTESNEYIGDVDLNKFTGDAVILNYENSLTIELMDEIYCIDLTDKIILIYTDYDKNWNKKEYFTSHPVLTIDFAKFVIKSKVKLIGIDFPSPDKEPFEIHKLLLENGIFILENLTGLNQLLNKENIQLMAFPLNLSADSSPVRAVARID